MYYNNYRDFCPCQATSCHVACAVPQLQLQRSKIFGHVFIYIWHAHQFMYCIFHLWQVQLQGQTWNE